MFNIPTKQAENQTNLLPSFLYLNLNQICWSDQGALEFDEITSSQREEERETEKERDRDRETEEVYLIFLRKYMLCTVCPKVICRFCINEF